MEAGAWPFLVGGVICLVKSDNERDLNLLNSAVHRVVSVRVGLRFGACGGCRLVVGGLRYFLERQLTRHDS
jgi:Fe-S cluster biogenesis protein NfuA